LPKCNAEAKEDWGQTAKKKPKIAIVHLEEYWFSVFEHADIQPLWVRRGEKGSSTEIKSKIIKPKALDTLN